MAKASAMWIGVVAVTVLVALAGCAMPTIASSHERVVPAECAGEVSVWAQGVGDEVTFVSGRSPDATHQLASCTFAGPLPALAAAAPAGMAVVPTEVQVDTDGVTLVTITALDGKEPPLGVCHSIALPYYDVTSALPASVSSNPDITVRTMKWNYNGTESYELIPSDNWQPETATDAELEYFGIPERPTSGPERAAWDDEWIGHYSGTGILYDCADKSDASTGGFAPTPHN